jgi:hypothetical protein
LFPVVGNMAVVAKSYEAIMLKRPSCPYTKLQSKAYKGGKEEATQAYLMYVEEPDDAVNECRRMNATWY